MHPPPIDQLFLITGTTRGIGKALVSAALQQPNSFVVSLSRAQAFLWDNHQNINIDLNDTAQIGAALATVHFDFQQLVNLKNTILINNAGVLEPISPISDSSDSSDSLLEQNIRVNLIAPLILSRHFYRFSHAFEGNKWIVNITSGAGRAPYFGWSAYCSAKAGLDMATAAMALEFSTIDPRFHICAVAPGTVDTDMQATIRSCSSEQFAQVDKFLQLKASGSLTPPERAASALIHLLLEGRFKNGGRYDLREMSG